MTEAGEEVVTTFRTELGDPILDAFPAFYQVRIPDRSPECIPDYELVPSGWAAGPVGHVSVVTGEGVEWTACVAGLDPIASRAVSGLYTTSDPNGLLIVQAGAAYLVSVSEPDQYRFMETGGHVTGVRQAFDTKQVLLATNWTVSGISRSGLMWTTRRLAIEGVRMDDIDGLWVRGVADPDDDEPREFAVNLSTGASVGGSFQ